MKPIFLCVVVFLFLNSLSMIAQNNSIKTEQEIIEQVWKPFKKSYESRDREAFKNIHTDNMLRITDMEIRTGKEYKANIDQWTTPPEGTTITIDFALASSNYREDVAYQVGYYRVKYTSTEEPPATYFGQFHVVLKKENGVWKIAQDFDTSIVNGKEVDESFFKNAKLLDLYH